MHTHKTHKFLPIPQNIPITPFDTKKIITFIIICKKYTYKSENTLVIPFLTKKMHFNHVKKSIPTNLKIFS